MTYPGDIGAYFPAMEDGTRNIKACYDTLVQQKADLERYLQNLDSSWQGVGHERWTDVQSNWNQSANHVYEILGNLQRVLGEAHLNYTTNEALQARRWSL